MAAITVSTDTFLDTAPGTRAPGDTVTFSAAATFTIRTDTRWYSGAPTGMTGTLGGTGSFRGSKYLIDGTKVRMIPFTNGAAYVPPINTIITQPGSNATGTLLAVYPNLISAPVGPGQPMPFSGYLKFREVTNGPFLSNATFNNIQATANGQETAGWIEVVYESNANIGSGQNGEGLIVSGAWFDLGVTSGAPGQLIQCPTNGGGANTYINGIQIETAPGSGVFEWYPSLLASDRFTTANLSTDIRSKFVQFVSNGQVRIGSDGTTNIGYTPPAGCAMRIPNIFIRAVVATARATNVFPATASAARPNLLSTAGTKINVDKAHLEAVFNAAGTSAKLTNSICEIPPATADLPTGDFSNTCVASYLMTSAARMALSRCSNIKLDNVKLVAKAPASFSGIITLTTCTNITGDNIELINLGPQGSGNYAMVASMCDGLRFNRLRIKGGTFNFTAKILNSTFTNIDYCDNVVGTTSTAGPTNFINIDTSNNVMFDGITTGENGVIPNVAWYGVMLNIGTYGSDNITVRNVGTVDVPISVGPTSTTYPGSVINAAAISRNIKVQRVYIGGLRVSTLLSTQSAPNLVNSTLEYIYAGTASALSVTESALANTKRSGLFTAWASVLGGNALSIGSNWADYFSPDLTTTSGAIVWVASPPNTDLGTDYFVSSSSYSGYLGTALSLGAVGDTAYTEMPYFAKGHTGFQNVAPAVKGTSATNYAVDYQIDNGAGFSGTWKSLTGANLSAETVNPSGFKMRLRFTLTSAAAATTSTVTSVTIATTTTPAARSANQYPLDVVTLSFEGLVPGSEVRAYEGTNPATAVQIGGIESVGGSTWSFTHSSSGKQGYIHIFAMGYQPIMIPRTYAFTDSSLLIQQVIDRNYYNP